MKKQVNNDEISYIINVHLYNRLMVEIDHDMGLRFQFPQYVDIERFTRNRIERWR